MSELSLFIAGDFCSKPSTSMISVSEPLRSLIKSCDVKVINFEAPLKPDVTMPKQVRERLYQHDDSPAFLKGLGFNVFSIANNHSFDWGEEGFKKTRSALGGAAIGAGYYDEAYEVKVVEASGKRIGFLALSFAAYTGVFDDEAKYDGVGCAYINDLKVNHVIIEAKKEVDYLFILPHDGVEYIDAPVPETVARYRDFIEYGADGVFASHPHTPQGWEFYMGKPIFYSLGNFYFNSKDGYDYRVTNRPHWYEGLSVVLTIEDDGISTKVINTRNVDNISIVIDDTEERKSDNEVNCRYLSDKALYWKYFESILDKVAYIPFANAVEMFLYPSSFIKISKFVINYLRRKVLGAKKNEADAKSLERYLKNDSLRQLVLWAFKCRNEQLNK